MSLSGFFDTHAHFTTSREEVGAILRRAKEASVNTVMAVGGSGQLNAGARLAFDMASDDPDQYPRVMLSVGYDRDQLDSNPSEIDHSMSAAVGEIGLDYYYEPQTRSQQIDLFAAQLSIAQRRSLPVVVHTREADDDTLGVLRDFNVKGVIHCFTGSPVFCRRLLDLGFYISMSGIVTFRAADNVRETVKVVPRDRLLIETDTPFLAPVPKRGQSNEPAFVVHTAKFLSEYLSLPIQTLAEITTLNAYSLFAPGASI